MLIIRNIAVSTKQRQIISLSAPISSHQRDYHNLFSSTRARPRYDIGSTQLQLTVLEPYSMFENVKYSLNSFLCGVGCPVQCDANRRKHRKMFTIIFVVTGVALFCYFIRKWLTAHHKYFEKYGLRHMKPAIPFGNTFGFYAGQYSGPDFISMVYNQFPGEK